MPMSHTNPDTSHALTLLQALLRLLTPSACPRHLAFGRIVIIVLPIVGMLPLLASPTALDATTTSGTG
jgi:hypothetical protein